MQHKFWGKANQYKKWICFHQQDDTKKDIFVQQRAIKTTSWKYFPLKDMETTELDAVKREKSVEAADL